MRPPGGRVFLKNASNGTVAIFRLVCRGGACPARGLAVVTILRVLRRGGIYAARCSLPGKSTYRGNRTGRNHAFPANLPVIRCPRKILQLPQNSPAGWGHLALRGNKKSLRGRGGACPARGLAVVTILRVLRRGGIYAARCSLPGKSTYRRSRRERNYAFPANPPKVRNISIQRFNSPPGGRIL